ncbi:MAG: hypothetical protein Q8L55_15120 [Phycisphaerales bacterium]|nr:hypothetical protein [Phycisphaerales bacterium]
MADPASHHPLYVGHAAAVLASAAMLIAVGCSGSGLGPNPPPSQQPEVVGPRVDAGPEFPIASSRLDARVFSVREGESLPSEVVELIKAQSQALPEPVRTTLASRGLLGALLSDTGLEELERLLTLTPAPPPPLVQPPPSAASAAGRPSGVATSGGSTGPQEPSQPTEAIFGAAPRGAPVNNLASMTIQPSPTWAPLLDAPPRSDRWALSLDQAVVSLKPGTLRWYVRAWPAPAEAIPTAGLAADLRVQFLPVVTGVFHEAAPDPLAPPPLSTDLAARGQVLGRQAFTLSLRGGASLVLIALPAGEASSAPGPRVEPAPMLGQALLGSGPPPIPTGRPTGPRVLVLRALVPGTYRLLLDRPAAPAANDAR